MDSRILSLYFGFSPSTTLFNFLLKLFHILPLGALLVDSSVPLAYPFRTRANACVCACVCVILVLFTFWHKIFQLHLVYFLGHSYNQLFLRGPLVSFIRQWYCTILFETVARWSSGELLWQSLFLDDFWQAMCHTLSPWKRTAQSMQELIQLTCYTNSTKSFSKF